MTPWGICVGSPCQLLFLSSPDMLVPLLPKLGKRMETLVVAPSTEEPLEAGAS